MTDDHAIGEIVSNSTRKFSYSGACHAAKSNDKRSIKSQFNLKDLPKKKLGADGLPLQSLGAWRPDTEISNLSSKSHTDTGQWFLQFHKYLHTQCGLHLTNVLPPVAEVSLSAIDEEAQVEKAIEEGTIPSSTLAREVYTNWLRFPDCILLTRVGKFYESYFEPARHLSSILNIKLAQKSYKIRDPKFRPSKPGESPPMIERKFPFAGFPVAALDKYLKVLVQELGHTVVLVEEYDEEGAIAFVGKKVTASIGLKERRVYRVITPGTMIDEGWLDGSESRYLLAIAMGKESLNHADQEGGGMALSLAYTDPSTGEFFTKETTLSNMEDELARIAPREIVLDQSLKSNWTGNSNTSSSELDEGISELMSLLQILGVHISFANPHQSPPLWGTDDLPSDLDTKSRSTESMAIALLRYQLQYALRDSMPSLSQPSRQNNQAQMQIDAATLQALEIRHALRPGGLVAIGERQNVSPLSSRGTLLSVISKTITQSGHRLLIRTLTSPSTCLQIINDRLALVQAMYDREDLREELRDSLRGMEDVMRIVQRFRGQRGSNRDIWDVGLWIRTVEGLLNRIKDEVNYEKHSIQSDGIREGMERLQNLIEKFEPLGDLAEKIEISIDENAIMRSISPEEGDESMEDAGDAMLVDEGEKSTIKETKETKKERIEREKQEKEDRQWWILPTFSADLQRLHDDLALLKIQKDKLQADLIKRYNAPSIKLLKGIRYGYHVQITSTDISKVEKARSLERIGGTSGKIAYYAYGPWSALGGKTEIAIETLSMAQRRAERDLRNMVIEGFEKIQRNAELIDEIDLTMSFAQNAREMGWVRPELNDSNELHIVAGRHPSIESSLLSSGRTFTPNNTTMKPSSHLHIITGPNQGGKSTLLRQTALITILAQSGSFVPATKATIGIVDRVFSRVGARDDLWRDRSTFMLEMVETASILKHATNRSLVIMDEIGRGTTLQAGVSIAYATLDHILDQIRCRTMFATHYHELGKMLGYNDDKIASDGEIGAKGREGVQYWCTDVDEVDGDFSYSYKLRPGINHHSHAIKAARLAGMPESFLQIAESTLKQVQATGRFDPPNHFDYFTTPIWTRRN
ncbi:uncharacterized protein IL334_000594 [Kwoniella shivajii]|uniref:DNA mismatch repair protein n=1 Tax=Kwoniella shivajii TaxID=564305 RepID=A0ABZ1CPK4_9TREE|nr:hypothetical protein IL334_000594 [Kwoniella shivajii]